MVANLETLNNALQFVDEQWKADFFEPFGAIFDINLMEEIDRSNDPFYKIDNETNEKLIKNSVLKLKALIRKRFQ